MKKVSSITLIGRRWFNRGPGNTYHSCEVLVNGQRVHRIDYAYGYGSAWADSGLIWLKNNGHLCGIDPGREMLSSYCERMGIAYSEHVTDVTRKKDL